MGYRGIDHPFIRDRQFALAARRLRSGEAGIHLIRHGQGRPLALSAHAARTSRDKAAVGRLDLSCAFRGDALVGNRMAVAVAYRCARARVRVIPRCLGRVWKSRRRNCSQRLWSESAEPAAGHARAHRHAAGTCDFSDRPADLAKGPT